MTQALWAFGGAVGSILGGLLGSRLGRKNTLLLNNVFLSTGIILQVRTAARILVSICFAYFSLSHFKRIIFHITGFLLVDF